MSDSPRPAAGTARVEMYTKTWCPYCTLARRLLDARDADVTEINVEEDAAGLARMLERTGGRRTVPQIFIGERHVGGYDELAALERAGQLESLLLGG